MSVRDLLGKGILLCDGAMGTMMQKYGLRPGQIPESLNFTDPGIISRIYDEYLKAGSDLICTNTFGANRWKLGGAYTVSEVVERGVEIALDCALRAARERGVAHRRKEGPFVALDLAPVGRLMEPMGDMRFDEAADYYKEQIIAGVKAGADLLFFETFTDLHELKAGVVAAGEVCDLPVFCSVTFQDNGRMLMGADPLTVVCTLQDLGIDALGVNCSLGPAQMIPIVKEMLRHSKLPILVQPNAGLPQIKDGIPCYDVGPVEFADAMEEMMDAGAAVVGGCCGTTPDYIRLLAERIGIHQGSRRPVTATPAAPVLSACSATRTVLLDGRIRIIGERINPTGKKRLKEALRQEDYGYVEDEAVRQAQAGAAILDINVGLPEIDEKKAMLNTIRRVSQVTDLPLQIDSADPEVLEAACRIYRGKPIVNSVNGKQEVMDAVFPIVKKYGANVIALTLDENGLPENGDERLTIAERILKEAARYGIGKERILVDCLTLTISAQQNAGKDTLEAMGRVKQRFGVKTTLGASNVSFGLPQRKLLNRTFLAMALSAGLDAPITDPLEGEYVDTIRSFEALTGKDEESQEYIAAYGGSRGETPVGEAPASAGKQAVQSVSRELSLEEIIIQGYEERAGSETRRLLECRKPLDIVEKKIIPALEQVGREYETGEKFLPQLIKSADTVQKAFAVLKEAMEQTGESLCYGRVILATVEGDIHDIGKNIVKVLLENYGYEVLDLGKDTPAERVVETARRENIRLVGLSALMTTTVANMEKTISALRKAGLACKTAVGGAVLTPEYARKIGADFYCKDAMDTVRAANSIFKG